MLVKETIEKVKQSKAYQDWKPTHAASFLAHFFTVPEDNLVEVGFYNKDDTITSFTVSDEITLRDSDQIFKREDAVIKELDLDQVKISLAQALDIVTELQTQEYKGAKDMKRIVILQCLDVQVWNISAVLQNLDVLNVKVDASTGDVVKHSVQTIVSSQQ